MCEIKLLKIFKYDVARLNTNKVIGYLSDVIDDIIYTCSDIASLYLKSSYMY